MPSLLSTNSVYWSPVTTYFELTATITQNISTNTSSIAYQLITRQTPTGSGYYRSINSCTVTINGTTSTAMSASTVSNGTVLQSGTVNVTHNNDGNKTVSISVNVNVGGTTASGSTNYVLDTIPRASSLTVGSDNIVISGTSGNVSYTVSPKANFYHKLELVFGAVTTPITIGQKSADYTSNVTYAQLLSTVTTATSGSVVFRLSTYSDSGYSTLVGISSVSVPITITLVPTVTIGTLTADNSAMRTESIGSAYFVAGYSKVNIPYTAINTSGSTGVTAYASVNKSSLTTSSITGTSGTFTTTLLPASSTDYSDFTVTMYVKDSRGATSATVTKTISTVYGYTPPTATLTAYRVLTNTSQQEDFTGNYVYVAWTTPTITSINSQNSASTPTATYEGSGPNGSFSGTITNGDYFELTDNQYATVELVVSDRVTSITIYEDIGVVAMPLDLYQEGTEVGVAFGEEAESGLMKTGLGALLKSNYGTCTTAAATQEKVVTTLGGKFKKITGAVVTVKFTNAQTYNGSFSLNIDDTGATTVAIYGTTVSATYARYCWGAGEVVQFVFDGTYYVMFNGYPATTTYFGVTKLVNSVTSTSNAYAATPNSVKTAYDLANTANTAATTSTTTDSVITKSSGVATLNSSSAIVQGKTVSVTLSITGTSASQTAGANIFVGSLAEAYRPTGTVSAVTFYSAITVIGLIASDGTVTVRFMSAGSTGTTFNFTWTFVQS